MEEAAIPSLRLRPLALHMVLARREARLRLTGRFWQRRFVTGLLEGGTDSACLAAGVTIAWALAARMKDRRFRAAWEAADAERLRSVESVLVDGLLATAGRKEAGGAKPLDKGVLSAWQALRDERRRGMEPPVTAPLRAAPTKDGDGPARRRGRAGGDSARAAAQAAGEIDAIIARVEAGIAAAEAELGLAPGGAERPQGS